MKKLLTKEYDADCRVAGKFNNSTIAIARAVTNAVLPQETLHYHSKATEYYIFIRGSAELLVEDTVMAASAGDVLVIEPGEKHKLINFLEETDYMAIRDVTDDDKVIV